jgi:hypothetical protein
LDHVSSYLDKHPHLKQSVKSNFNALIPARQQAFINGLKNAAKDALNISNARRAFPDEIFAALNRIKNHRAVIGDNSGNYGYIEGQLSSFGQVNNKLWRSGAANPNTEPQIFQAISV